MHIPKNIQVRAQAISQVRTLPLVLAAALLLSLASLVLMARPTEAVFTNAFVRIDRMKASTATGGRVCADPATAGTEDHVRVTFPTGFTVNGTASNWTVDTANLDSGQTAWPSINTASSVAGQVVTFPSGDLTHTGTTLYCFNFAATNTLTTSTAGDNQTGTIATRDSGNTVIDESGYALSVISEDQINVTASVPATFSFSIASCTSGNCTDAFTADLSPGAIRTTTGKAVTINTNANSGWIAWVKDSQQGLRSTVRSHTIASTTAGTACSSGHDLSAGTEGYGLDVDLTTNGSGGGNPSIDANYNCGANQAGGLSANFLPIASSNGGANGDVITLIAKAAIGNLTPSATDYQDIITVVGAGNF